MKMKFCIVLLFIANECICQNDEKPYQLPYNSFNIEVFGNSYLYGSLNYERIFFHRNDLYLSGRVGIGYIYFYNGFILSAPLLFNVIYHVYKDLSLEGGVGTTLFFQQTTDSDFNGVDPVLTGFIGMRLQTARGFCFRAGFVPFYDFMDSGANFFSNHFEPWGGISFGYSFGKK
jgi:hypothetical protein